MKKLRNGIINVLFVTPAVIGVVAIVFPLYIGATIMWEIEKQKMRDW